MITFAPPVYVMVLHNLEHHLLDDKVRGTISKKFCLSNKPNELITEQQLESNYLKSTPDVHVKWNVCYKYDTLKTKKVFPLLKKMALGTLIEYTGC